MDEELLARQTPQALEAEQSVLGSMLIDERCVPDVVGMLQPEDFYLRQNREIYETIYTMFNFSEKIDPVTVLNKMKERGVYDEERSYDYLAQLLKITPTAANVKQYCTIVHDKSLLRALAALAGWDAVVLAIVVPHLPEGHSLELFGIGQAGTKIALPLQFFEHICRL